MVDERDRGVLTWVAWARLQVDGLSSTARLALLEVAGLVDTAGAAIVEVSWLAGRLGKSERYTRKVLARLEDAGLLVRQARREDGRQGPSRLQLVRGIRERRVRAEVALSANLGVDQLGPDAFEVIDPEDNEGLRRLVREAVDQGWQGVASARIAATAVAHGTVQFWRPIARARQFDGMSAGETLTWVLTIAWLTLRDSPATVLKAKRPWATWTRAVVRACANESTAGQADRDAVTFDGVLPEAQQLAWSGAAGGMQDVSVDDFSGPLLGVVKALVGAGLSETMAWAGSVRCTQIILDAPASKQHTMAAKDLALANMGVGAAAARAWVSLIVGSRRGAVPGADQASADDLALQASRVVTHLNTLVA